MTFLNMNTCIRKRANIFMQSKGLIQTQNKVKYIQLLVTVKNLCHLSSGIRKYKLKYQKYNPVLSLTMIHTSYTTH